MNKKLIIAAGFLAVGIVGFGLYGVQQVRAQEDTAKPLPFVEDLAVKLNIDSSEVQTAFEDVKAARKDQFKAEREEKLEQAVEDGVITAEQRQVLLEKQEEMRQYHAQHKAEMQAWMEESGIDFTALREYGCGYGFGGGFKRGPRF